MIQLLPGQEAIQEDLSQPDSSLIMAESRNIQELIIDFDFWLLILNSGARIFLTIVLAWILIRIIDKATRKWNKRFELLPENHPRRQRAFTVGTLLTSSARYLLWPLAIIMVLSELQLDVTALLATAGIAGIAIGFGAQTLVQDFISGVFLLFDDTIHVGDWVRVGSNEGTVEYIGVRLIKVRKFNGELLMVPAGELRTFGNRSIDYTRVVVNIGLAYEQDLDATLLVMQRIADEWAEEHKTILKEERPQVQAIIEFGDSTLHARIIVQVMPGEQWEAERELRQRLKREFDKLGIEIPFPRRTIYMKQEESKPQTAT